MEEDVAAALLQRQVEERGFFTVTVRFEGHRAGKLRRKNILMYPAAIIYTLLL